MKYNLRNIMMGCLGVGIIMSVTSAAGAANVLERALVEKTAYALITAQNSDINQSYMQFDKDSMIELADTMYDFRENPSAYKYNVYAENGDYEGYIILGAQDCYAPIIEYGFRNQDARAQIIEEKPEGKLYYTGGIGYLVERKDANGVSVYIDSETRNVVTRQNIEQNDYNREDFSADWNALIVSTMSEPITDPSSETAYLRLIEDHTTFLATKAEYISSKTYNKHSNDCGPVAATNYCAFYAKVHGIKFSRDWEAIYDDLYDLSGTNGSGTDAKRLAKAMEQTWEKESRPRKITNLDEIDWGDAFEDVLHPLLANDKGVIIYLENNSCYGDHFVFGYGYQMYKYNNVRRNYIHIKDGETVSHERYIFVDKTIKAMIY